MKETTAAPTPRRAPAAETAAPDPFAVIEKLSAENAELKDRLLRALAEMENLRRRTEREIADSRAYGVTTSPATCSPSPITSPAPSKAFLPTSAPRPTPR